MSNHSYIAAGHEKTLQVGADILQAGGNAYDAAIGAVLCACVCEISTISLGGGGFLLAAPNDSKPVLFDFFSQTPIHKRAEKDLHFEPINIDFKNTSQTYYIGMGAIAVPGIIAGLFHVHAQLGKMPFKEIASPVIEMAKKGVELDAYQELVFSIIKPILAASPVSKTAYFNGDELKKKGDKVRIEDLGATIDLLAHEGPREFYQGEIARQISRDCLEYGGHLRMEDMLNYQVIERSPLHLNYRGHDIYTNPAPSAGGILIMMALKLLSKIRMGEEEFGSQKHIQYLTDAMDITARFRSEIMEKQGREKAQALLGTDLLAQYEELFLERAMKKGGTTHISIMDKDRNAASVTISSGEGAGYFIPNTGIMLNNMLGEEDLNPLGYHRWLCNERISSMMAPTIVKKDGIAQAVLGAGGSNRIRSAILQVLVNSIDFNLPINEAVNHPRLHLEGQHLEVEYGFDPDLVRKTLADKRWYLNFWKEQHTFFGGVHSIAHYKKQMEAFGDLRRNGYGKKIM